MSAKFIAQIEISKPCVSTVSRPAEATRPRIVSISGRPAATSDPKASTRISIVTGQEKSSDFIIAVRFAVLKSLHIPEAPVRETLTSALPAAFSFDFSASAAATIVVGSPLAPAVTTAVWPSAEMLVPALRLHHGANVGVRLPGRVLYAADRSAEAGSRTVSVLEWTTTINAELESPAKFALDQVPGLYGL